MKPIKYRGYELVPVFEYKTLTPSPGHQYIWGPKRCDWEIFKEGNERGFGLHYKTIEEAKEYVNDLIEE